MLASSVSVNCFCQIQCFQSTELNSLLTLTSVLKLSLYIKQLCYNAMIQESLSRESICLRLQRHRHPKIWT